MYLTDGCLDVGRAPDLYLNEIAREIAPGTDDGKLWRRNSARSPDIQAGGAYGRAVQSGSFSAYIRQAKETYSAALHGGHPVSLAAFKQASWHQRAILSLEQTQLSVRSPFLDNDFVRTVFRAPESALVGNEVCMRLIADGDKALLRVPTDRGLAGERRPFSQALSHGFLEFLFKAEYAYDSGMPQWVAQNRLFPFPSARWNDCSSEDTSPSNFECGIAINWLNTLRKSCSTRAAFQDRTLNENSSRQLYGVTLRGIAITPTRFTSC